jgi:hypothetical protein
VQVLNGSSDLSQPVPVNTKDSITLDSQLFKGTINIQIRCVSAYMTTTAAAAVAGSRSRSSGTQQQ